MPLQLASFVFSMAVASHTNGTGPKPCAYLVRGCLCKYQKRPTTGQKRPTICGLLPYQPREEAGLVRGAHRVQVLARIAHAAAENAGHTSWDTHATRIMGRICATMAPLSGLLYYNGSPGRALVVDRKCLFVVCILCIVCN